jgi:hypothetical protein
MSASCPATRTEDLCRIDIRRWSREGKLWAGNKFNVSWDSLGETVARMDVRVEDHALQLTHRWIQDGQPYEGGTRWVPIVWTECRLGGRRAWFVCSSFTTGRCCSRRVAILYGQRKWFACRHCHGLRYSSQNLTVYGRSLARARKIRLRLGGTEYLGEPYPSRPKGMHQRTYERLRRIGEAAETRAQQKLLYILGMSLPAP